MRNESKKNQTKQLSINVPIEDQNAAHFIYTIDSFVTLIKKIINALNKGRKIVKVNKGKLSILNIIKPS